MKKLGYSWFLVFCLMQTALAQTTTNLPAELSPAGVYLNLGEFPKKGETLIVARDKGQGFETIGSLSSPTTKSMLYQRMLNYALRLPNYYRVTDQLATNIWQMIQNGQQDSLRKGAVPVMLLALGGAFLDTSANLPMDTRYRIQMNNRKFEFGLTAPNTSMVKSHQLIFYSLAPANQAIRAEWRLKIGQKPALLEVHRQRLGIDSSFSALKTDLGYEKTKNNDSLRVHLSDTTVLTGITYLYFLAGKDLLGRIITHSDTIRSIAGNRTTVNGITKLTTKTAIDSSGILLQWNKQNEKSIRSIRVFRSAYYDSAYVQLKILAPTDTVWTDRSAAIGANYYYQLVAQGNGDFSYPSPRVFGSFMNNQRLLPPTALRVIEMVNSTTKLTWKYHTYMNVLGFRLYRALGNSGKFEAISDVISAPRDSLQFTYTVQDPGLAGHQFYSYAVAAVSRSFKESPLSALAEVNVTERKKPTAPTQVRSLSPDERSVLVTWQDMSAVDPSVIGYQVYRKSLGADSSKGYIRINSQLLRGINEFADTPGLGHSWQYVVRSINQSDSSTYSLPTGITLQGNNPLPPGKVRAFHQKNSVIINWDPTLIPDITQYYIYRASKGMHLARIGAVDTKTYSFEDKNTQKGIVYFYYVTTENSQKIESDRSVEISIRL